MLSLSSIFTELGPLCNFAFVNVFLSQLLISSHLRYSFDTSTNLLTNCITFDVFTLERVQFIWIIHCMLCKFEKKKLQSKYFYLILFWTYFLQPTDQVLQKSYSCVTIKIKAALILSIIAGNILINFVLQPTLCRNLAQPTSKSYQNVNFLDCSPHILNSAQCSP